MSTSGSSQTSLSFASRVVVCSERHHPLSQSYIRHSYNIRSCRWELRYNFSICYMFCHMRKKEVTLVAVCCLLMARRLVNTTLFDSNVIISLPCDNSAPGLSTLTLVAVGVNPISNITYTGIYVRVGTCSCNSCSRKMLS